jgi:glycosyltransferase involved in cell wall biosynthesis
MKPRIHLIAPFHTIPNAAFSHCAFTGKSLRFVRMLQPLGYHLIEYANAGSEAGADEPVVMLSRDELEACCPPLGPTESHARDAVIGSPAWHRFDMLLRQEMTKRVQPGDVIGHPFGRAHMDIVKLFPQAHHVETGIGYNDAPFGAWRIFESEAWRHYHWGHYDYDAACVGDPGLNRFYSWVIPNYFDLEEWPLDNGSGDYVLFMGRIDPCKGLLVAADIIRAWDKRHPGDGLKFVFAGQGDFDVLRERIGPELQHRVDYRGSVLGKDRAPLVGKARCMIMPTQFTEPFGGAGIEGMLTGTPLVASDWGAFTETITPGVNGYRCKTMGDWILALEALDPARTTLHRSVIATRARERYSLQACAALYDHAFQQLRDLSRAGWYEIPAP